MSRILVLGSKPDPKLPEAGSFDRVFCANASPQSAARLGLPMPDLTVMTALLTDGSDAGRNRIKALMGLRTRRLFYYPRPEKHGSLMARLRSKARNWRMRPWVLRRALQRVGFTHDEFISGSVDDIRRTILRLCGEDPEIARQLDRKQASSGLVAIALALDEPDLEEVVISGFSFELTQAFGVDPNIEHRGTTVSRHKDTDVLVLARLAPRHPLRTTESSVHRAADVSLIGQRR